jgi:hypothetical protein
MSPEYVLVLIAVLSVLVTAVLNPQGMTRRKPFPAIAMYSLTAGAFVCGSVWFSRQTASPLWLVAVFFLQAASVFVWRLAFWPPDKN